MIGGFGCQLITGQHLEQDVENGNFSPSLGCLTRKLEDQNHGTQALAQMDSNGRSQRDIEISTSIIKIHVFSGWGRHQQNGRTPDLSIVFLDSCQLIH